MRVVVVLVMAVALSALACEVDETHVENISVALVQASAYMTCSSPFVKVDLDTLPACGGGDKGSGHCYDGTKVPITPDQLTPCAGGTACVPDAILSANGGKSKSCTFSFNGQPGACQSLLMTGVYQNKDFLKSDGCADDERCLPCIDPRDGSNTQLCNATGAHEAACTGGLGNTPTPCCHLMGECIESAAVPPNLKSTMVKDSCPGTKLCAPASQLESKPEKCDVLGAPGVCLDECFLGSIANGLTRSTCGPTESCIPCALANTFGGSQKLLGC